MPPLDIGRRDEAGVSSEPIPPALASSPEYEVLREISRGGMGVVYLARNRRMDRLEALKVVKAVLLERPGALERFQREMRAAARLSHPHIVTAYSSPPLEGLLSFAMEYVDGIDLHQLVKTRGSLPVSNACYYVYQAAQGLQHAHDRQMVHRDIKPNNLMLTRDGKKQVIKILDFGLAKATSENPIDAGLTGEGQVLGTPHYMAPEQIVQAAKADIRADIYSLGCTSYYLLTGAPPFQDKKSVFEILQSHRSIEAPPLGKLRPDVPVELTAIVAKMIAKDPAQRYQQPVDLARALMPFFRQGVKPIPTGTARFSAPSPGTQTAPETAGSEAVEATRLPHSAPAAPTARMRAQWPRGLWVGLAAVVVSLGFLGLWAGGLLTGVPKTSDGRTEIGAENREGSRPKEAGQVSRTEAELTASIERDPGESLPAEKTVIGEPRSEETHSEPTSDREVQTTAGSASEGPSIATPTTDTIAETPSETGASPPDFQPADLLKAARTKYANEVKRAERELLAHFDKEIEGLAKVKLKPEDRVHLIESLKAEKTVFETRQLIPWSRPMRGAVLAYLRELMQADAAIVKSHDRHISAAVKAKDESAIEKLRAELRAAAPRRLLGAWVCTGVTFKGAWKWKLYSDGTFSFGDRLPVPGDEWLWALDSQGLTVKTRYAKDPKVQAVDRCLISTDGTLFTGENNRKDRFSGKIDRSGN